MTAPLDERVAEVALDPGRTWGPRDAVLALLAVPASLLLTVLVLAAVPGVPSAVGVVVASVVLAAATVVVVRRPARESGGLERALGFDLPLWSDTGRILTWALLLLLAQSGAVLAAGALVPALEGVEADNASFLRDQPPLALVALALAAVLVAPVLEEVLFRGVVLRGLMLRAGFWPAAVVSSVCFGALHATGTGVEAVPVVIATVVFGLGLCLLTRRTGRLGPGIGVHALRNAVAVWAVVAGG